MITFANDSSKVTEVYIQIVLCALVLIKGLSERLAGDKVAVRNQFNSFLR
jgi:hypothetical protein